MSSSANYMSKYMVNDQKYERECEIQRRIDRNTAFKGDVRDGFVTSLFLGDMWGERGGLSAFMATDWTTKLGDTFDALHEHYFYKDGENYRLKMPKDYEELERVARLFRETYVAYFIWHCMDNVEEGYSPTIWHELAMYVEDAYWAVDHYHEIWGLKEEEDPEKFLYGLWEVFFDRVYGRSRKFNFTNFVAANSALSMLEERYYSKRREDEVTEERVNVAVKAEQEKIAYEKTIKEVEEYLNGKD